MLRAYYPKVVGSNPTPATKKKLGEAIVLLLLFSYGSWPPCTPFDCLFCLTLVLIRGFSPMPLYA
jgi:hypothetical protein